MKVLISWSGERSKVIAQALHDWIPMVIQAVDPWIAPVDIEKGASWVRKLSDELSQTSFGIVCLTPENLQAPWILFEAGAISKAVGQENQEPRVCTYLFELEPANVGGPLAQFQHTKATREDTKLLLTTINQAVMRGEEKGLKEERLNELIDALWERLEERLKNVPEASGETKPQRTEREILVEILGMVRNQAKSPLTELPDLYSIQQRLQQAFKDREDQLVAEIQKRQEHEKRLEILRELAAEEKKEEKDSEG